MSIKVMNAVWEQDDLDASETLVMLALADWANDDGLCWPSLERLTEKTRLTERGLRGIILRLEERGYLERKKLHARGTYYTVKPRNYVPVEMPKPTGTSFRQLPEPRSANTLETHQTSSELSSPTLENNLKPSAKNNSSEEPRAKKSSSPVVVDPPPCVTPETWRAWVEMRVAKKKPPTEYAQQLMAKKLVRFDRVGWDAEKLLARSILHNWEDVYEPKRDDEREVYRKSKPAIPERIERW